LQWGAELLKKNFRLKALIIYWNSRQDYFRTYPLKLETQIPPKPFLKRQQLLKPASGFEGSKCVSLGGDEEDGAEGQRRIINPQSTVTSHQSTLPVSPMTND